jgi:uncharacterized 2Fe-2S/4Fe-4S cluster protein (DUF4445 family)
MPDNRDHIINFQPIGRRVPCRSNDSLLSAAQASGIDIASICGGVGICNSCKIRLIYGVLNPVTIEEQDIFTEQEIEAGFRLACQCFPQSDLTIEIPPESLTAPQRLQLEGLGHNVRIEPSVVAVDLSIPEPTIDDLRADTTRLNDALLEAGFRPPIQYAPPVLETLSGQLRSNRWNIRMAMRKKLVIAALPASTQLLGLAVDIGTTKLAAYLCRLQDGEIIAKAGAMNPQTAFGEDVISRISYTDSHDNGRKTLQSRLVETLNQLVHDLCERVSNENRPTTPDQIVEAVVVGNTAMHHLFAGLPVHQLGVAPYVPAVSEPMEIEADRIGLDIASGAIVYLPANIAGYVGADHVAMLLATGAWSASKTTIALDIGTNTEISLVHQGRIIACSCASGPAFEGAHIQFGMRAAPGAIERVQVIHDQLRIQTIDNIAPVGICGSGILDAIACMGKIGAMDHRGALINGHPLVSNQNKTPQFLLIDKSKSGMGADLVITRKDVNEIQLAKGAIRTGIEVLLQVAGIPAESIEDFIIAGAFGTYINIPSAIQIGMFPSLPLERFRQVGNAAGEGAREMLLSTEQRRVAEEFAKQLEYIELSTYPGFTNIYSKSLYIKRDLFS